MFQVVVLKVFVFKKDAAVAGIEYVQFLAPSEEEAKEWIRAHATYLGAGCLVPAEETTRITDAQEPPLILEKKLIKDLIGAAKEVVYWALLPRLWSNLTRH